MLPFEDLSSASDLFRKVRIARVHEVGDNLKTFELEPVGWELSYQPGQFLTFVIPSPAGLVRRSYSFCSIPGEAPTIAIKRVPNGVFSRPMLELAEPGDTLTVVGGASGFFTLPEQPDTFDQVFFFAAGSGITPVLGMIKQLTHTKAKVPVVLAYSNSRQKSTLFRKELEDLAKVNKHLSIDWFFSNRQDLMSARLSKTTLGILLEARMKGNPERTLAYLCGPFDYMRMAAIVLQYRGIPAENIRREVFTPDVIKSKTPPPDTSKRHVTIHIRGRVHELDVQYPATILSAARTAGIELPYSCESGRCGSCIAACTKGKVWMRYNEVLTDREVEKGRVLVCQSFPVGGDITIDYN